MSILRKNLSSADRKAIDDYTAIVRSLDAKDAELDRLRDTNKALLIENERLQSEWYEYRQFSIDYAVERDRANAAEAKLAKVEAERDAEIQEMSERFRAVNIAKVVEQSGVDFITLAAEKASLSAELAEARKIIKPFSDIAGEMFSRGWDASNVALALDNPDDPHRVTAGDFYAARSFLASKAAGQ